MRTLFLFSVIGTFIFYSCAWFTKKPKEEKIEAPSYEETLQIVENYVTDGVTYFEHSEDSLAVITWGKALELKPGDAEIHNWIGIAYFRMNKLDEALNHYNLATALDSTYYQAFNNLGYTHFLKKDYDAANQAYQKSLLIRGLK